MVVVAARTDERSLLAVSLLQLEPEHTAPESERALDIGHLQVDVADVDARIDRHAPRILPAAGTHAAPRQTHAARDVHPGEQVVRH